MTAFPGTAIKVPIEQVKVGERVLARNEQTGEQSYQRVVDVFSHGESAIYSLRLRNGATAVVEELGVTAEHPFWHRDKGWTEAEDLKAGDQTLAKDGQWLEVVGVQARGEKAKAYNLTVEGEHSYFVGENQAWVHNTGCAPFSYLVPGGGLAAHEAIGGHLLARHVGKTNADLAARFAAQPNIPAVSTFVSRAEAEAAISGLLNARAADVNGWVATGVQVVWC